GVDHLHDRAGFSAAASGHVTGKNPRMAGSDAVRAFAADTYLDQRIAWSRAMRSAVDGCVEKSLDSPPAPPSGFMMNRCAVAGVASMGIRWEYMSSFCRPEIRPYGVPVYLAEVASAEYSRVREMASWIKVAAIGPRISMNSAPRPLPRSSSSRRPPKNIAM